MRNARFMPAIFGQNLAPAHSSTHLDKLAAHILCHLDQLRLHRHRLVHIAKDQENSHRPLTRILAHHRHNARVLLPEHLHLAGLQCFKHVFDRMGVATVIERDLKLSN